MSYPTPEQRLVRIAEAHFIEDPAADPTYCIECAQQWPCPTYQVAADPDLGTTDPFLVRDYAAIEEIVGDAPVIKIVLQADTGYRMLLLGLTGENVTRLVAGEPIAFALDGLADQNLDHLAICYGKDVDDIRQQMKTMGVVVPEMPEPAPGETVQWTNQP